MKRVGVDFDGTIVAVDATNALVPLPGVQEAMRALKEDGFYIIINSCRTGIAKSFGRLDAELDLISSVLKQFDIPYDEIHLGEKLVAEIYIDDRSVPFTGDWVKTLQLARQAMLKING